MRRLVPTLGLLFAVAGCATRGPVGVAERYAEALEAGRVDEAWETLDPQARAEVSQADFEAAMAEPSARREEAAAVRAAVGPGATASAPEARPRLVRRPDGWRVVPPPAPGAAAQALPEASARAALEAFLAAVEAGDFARVWSMLGPGLRGRYTPETLARDLEAGGEVARETLARLRSALVAGVPVEIRGDQAYVPLGGGQAVRLRHEGDAWRILSLQ